MDFETGVIAVLSAFVILLNGRAGYWRGKFESLNEEAGDHLDTLSGMTRFLEHAVNTEACKAAHESE